MKHCSNSRCARTNPQLLDNFTKNKKSKDKLQPWCKSCCKERHAEYQIKNREKVNQIAREWSRKNKEKISVKCKSYYAGNVDKIKDHRLRKEFGITLIQYKEMSAQQNHSCAICKQPETSRDHRGKLRYLAVDHCHKTGKIRGLLCQKHNRMLGLANDNADILKESVVYLDRQS